MNQEQARLIERAFCLKQASLDSVHEKNVRHGHISTLHIWPARRPLAACRAALIATLLPDPGTPEERKRLLERIGGTVVKKAERKKIGGRTIEIEREETVGGILHWGRESGSDLEWFRQEIRKAFGGRAPRVLDPFAGGGAIPLEAMRLGCEVTAADINPVAWFILKCTLEYPQKLAGQRRPLPEFVLSDRGFMEAYLKARGMKGETLQSLLQDLGLGEDGEQSFTGFKFDVALLEADLAWHVRAWGLWVLQRARDDLARFYPVVDRKPTVAYLWARTVRCKNCRAIIPLLKTRWLCKKDNNRVLLTMERKRDGFGVVFGVQEDVPPARGNAAQKREHDKRVGQGTMSRNGAWCPSCGQPGTVAMEMVDIRQEGLAGRLGAVMTAVVVDGEDGKEYRLPTTEEIRLAEEAASELERAFAEIPFGLPEEPTPKGGSGASRAFSVDGYGFDKWSKLFTPRQLLALGTFVRHTRAAVEIVRRSGYSDEWAIALGVYLAATIDRVAERNSTVCHYDVSRDSIAGTFQRYALPIVWDFCEATPIGPSVGGYEGQCDWVSRFVTHASECERAAPPSKTVMESAVAVAGCSVDAIVTDPPYYDAIPYSDLMNFFHVWLRRTLHGLSPEMDEAFRHPLGPKWDHERNDGELIDDASRHGGDRAKSRTVYEDGMFRAFQACQQSLDVYGRLVVVFAHKDPDAWEALVSAIIRAGFVVDGSWPIQTEMGNRTRALASAALSSSVWLICRKRPETARPGWDNRVLEEMRANIYARLRDFWDAGIRGPDFIWAATGPALEAYSRHPVVKKADEHGKTMEVSEFLRAVRRIVVDFVVGRLLSRDGGDTVVASLDDVTTYYLLHRYDFRLNDAPVGPCILYAVSCGLSDRELIEDYDILLKTGGVDKDDEGEEALGDEEPEEGTASRVKLKAWNQRTRPTMGHDAGGRPAPLIDQVHRLMHLWRGGDASKVDEYLDMRALRRNQLFHQLLQALIELSPEGSEERSLVESLSNHVAARGPEPQETPRALPFPAEAVES